MTLSLSPAADSTDFPTPTLHDADTGDCEPLLMTDVGEVRHRAGLRTVCNAAMPSGSLTVIHQAVRPGADDHKQFKSRGDRC